MFVERFLQDFYNMQAWIYDCESSSSLALAEDGKILLQTETTRRRVLPAVQLEPARLEALAEEMLYQAALLNPVVAFTEVNAWFTSVFEGLDVGPLAFLFAKGVEIAVPLPEFVGYRPFSYDVGVRPFSYDNKRTNLYIRDTRAVVRVTR